MKLKLKKIFKWTGITFVVLIALLIAIPYLFKGKIMAKVKEELNKQLNAKVDFKDVDISLIRRFPRLAVALEDFQVTGLAPFESDTLVSVHRLEAAMDLMSAIKGENIKVYSVLVKAPRIHAIVNNDGRVNWDIMKPDTATTTTEKTDTSSGDFTLSLQKYAIEDGFISYVDRQSNMNLQIEDLDHSGAGDFTQDIFTLSTKTTVGGVSFLYGYIPYLFMQERKTF